MNLTDHTDAIDLTDLIDEELWFGTEDTEAADRAASESLAASVARITGLKPFSSVARKLMEELQGNEWSAARVSSIMGSDPSLAGMVLRVANSSFYCNGRASTSIREAVVRVGGAKLCEMVIGAATMQVLGSARGRLARRWRDHCAGTAAVARVLAGSVGVHPGNLFLAGLMHDAGKLLLLDAGDIDYRSVPAASEHNDEVLPARERVVLGFDHAVLGGHVTRSWGIPEPVPKLVAWHHRPIRAWEEGGEIAQQLGLLRIADRLTECLDEGRELTSAELHELAESVDGVWADVDAGFLTRIWPRLGPIRAEALSIFSM